MQKPPKKKNDSDRLNIDASPNPFVTFPSNVGYYRFHPFFDYTAVHMKDAEGKIVFPPLDYFGFRNAESATYFERPKGVLVVMTGGSDAAGYTHQKTIAEHLQEKLTARLKKQVTVLNLSMNSYVLANEINAYVHLGAGLNPDLVISHSGWNDMIFGALAPQPFQKLGLNYMAQLVNWLPRFYDLKEDNLVKWEVRKEGLATVPDAYFKNVELFRRIVSGTSDAPFIAGLQGYNETFQRDELHSTVKNLMRELHTRARDSSMMTFNNLPIGYTDQVHTDNASAEVVAEAYAEAAAKKLTKPLKRQ